MIRQIIQVPENLTPVELITQEDGTELWEDTARNRNPVFLALTNEDEILPYVIDGTGVGMIDVNIQFRPSACCPDCGQKMWIAPHKDLSEPIVYECPCGKMRRIQVE